MKDNLQQLVTQIKSLPASDFQKLLDILLREDHSAPQSIEDFVSELKSALVYTCPYCGSTHIVRSGHRPDGIQKFRCNDCHRSFVPMTNTIFANTHKPLTAWQDYIKCVYCKFAKENELNLVQIKGGKETRGTFHIQHLNSYHSMLKKFIEKFNGVATKYLDGYLAWHNFLNYAKEGIADKARILKEWMVKCGKKFTRESIFTMPSLPFACR